MQDPVQGTMQSPDHRGRDWEGRKESLGSQMARDSQKVAGWLRVEGVPASGGHSDSSSRRRKDWLQPEQGSPEECQASEELLGWVGLSELWQKSHLLPQLKS